MWSRREGLGRVGPAADLRGAPATRAPGLCWCDATIGGIDDVVVARIGKAHGLKGEVTVQLHTDSPEQRFVPGETFETEPASRGPLTLRSARVHNGIHLLAFDEAPDRTAAEGLRGIKLLAEADDLDEDDAWYEEDLLGFDVVVAGEKVGVVKALESREVQDLLVVDGVEGYDILVPFVEEIVPEIDEDARVVVVTPPPGLLDLARPDAPGEPDDSAALETTDPAEAN